MHTVRRKFPTPESLFWKVLDLSFFERKTYPRLKWTIAYYLGFLTSSLRSPWEDEIGDLIDNCKFDECDEYLRTLQQRIGYPGKQDPTFVYWETINHMDRDFNEDPIVPLDDGGIEDGSDI